MSVHYTWRKLGSAKWEDAWVERLRAVSDRLAITALARAKTIRLEAFQLTRAQAAQLRKTFGGTVAVQKKLHAVSEAVTLPIRVRDRLIVVGSQRLRAAEQKKAGCREILWIPAGMAFGTGDHATTANCLRLLADVSADMTGQPWEMLDLGTGSGILALAARLLGARRAEAGDFDPHAVRTARRNAELNAITRVTIRMLDVREWRPQRTWHVVAANLFSDLLMEAAPKIAAAITPNGRLVFSGILRTQELAIVSSFRRAGLRVDRLVRKGKWVSGLATRILNRKTR